MKKIQMVKVLVMKDIKARRPLVLLACENEMEAYQAYLVELKDKYMKLPVDQLEGMVKGVAKEAA